jgi:hypothetical protein
LEGVMVKREWDMIMDEEGVILKEGVMLEC